ncbi:MAG: PEP-CTERM sorting domain-containing protein, partial [Isosphaeraceae bacterium]
YTTGVPEPSSLTLITLSGLCGLLWCYRRGGKRGPLRNSPRAISIEPR